MRLKIDLNEKANYSAEYLALHSKFNVPLTGLTSEQTRFFHYAFRNEINVFFRTCDFSGEKILSQFPQDTPFKVYKHEVWWGEKFDVAFMEYNSSKSFFEQFHELQLQMPRMGTIVENTVENCPYVNCVTRCKDCYMIFASGTNEDCLYCINLERSKTTMEASIAHECTFCYNIISCRNCYNVDFSISCEGCADSRFLYDCRGCKKCFLCIGLSNQEYHILNKKYTKEEYEQKMRKYMELDHAKIDQCFETLKNLRSDYQHKYANIINSEHCTGNDIGYSQDCLENYITEYSQNCINGSSLRKCKNCLDFNLRGDPGEMCYNSMSCGYGVYHLMMCFDCRNDCSYLTYCDSCPSSHNCFGCVGIKNREYCILNKQYSKKDYEELVARIIQDMKARGERGKFFPTFCSPHALNNSMTHEYFETNEKMALDLGFKRMDKESEYKYDPALVYAGSLNTNEIDYNDVRGKVLICRQTNKPYNIQKREFEILKKKNLPLPDKHRRTRLENRDSDFIFPRRLQKRIASDTGNTILSPVPEKYKIREKF